MAALASTPFSFKPAKALPRRVALGRVRLSPVGYGLPETWASIDRARPKSVEMG